MDVQEHVIAPVLLNGVPKSGTHLLHRVVGLLPGITSSGIAFHPDAFAKKVGFDENREQGIPIGVGRNLHFPKEAVLALVNKVRPGQSATGHVPYSDVFHSMLMERGWKTVTILRDPRDIVVSLATYKAEKPFHFFASQSSDDCILRSITGFAAKENGGSRLLSIDARYRRVLGWNQAAGNITTRFEDLVGEQGGGSLAAQAREIARIANHLKIELTNEALEHVIAHSFGSTATFRKGTLGRWRDAFSTEHKRAFKNCAGELLLELGYESGDQW